MPDLRAEFLDDRAATVLCARLRSEIPPDVCRYCMKYWRRPCNSTLDGHARCIVSEAFQRKIEFMWRTNPRATVVGLAAEIGVSKYVVENWIRRVDAMRMAEGRRAS